MRFIFFIIIAVLSIVAGVVAMSLSSKEPEPVVAQESPVRDASVNAVNILVAKSDIPVGTIINSSMVDTQPWPENLLLDNFILAEKDNESVIGKVARSAVQAHEPFIKSKLANPNDPGFLAAGLPPGMRAITVAVDAISGVAGFVFPGDRVDLLFVHNVPAAIKKDEVDSDPTGTAHYAGGELPSFAEVLASNVRVLAVNVREGDPSKPSAVSPNNVTLEVSDNMVQQIRLAEKKGVLSLSLRSIHDDNTTVPNPTVLSDLSKAEVSSSNKSPTTIVRGPGGTNSGKISKETVQEVQPDATPVVVNGVPSSTSPAAPSVVPASNNTNNSNH